MTDFLAPRVFAGLSVVCVVAAPVYPAGWGGRGTLLVAAAAFAYVSHSLAATVRRRRRLARRLRHVEPRRNVRVIWQPPLTNGSDPAVTGPFRSVRWDDGRQWSVKV